MMKKTIAYIDGFNLYYGLLQKVPRYKWLDPFAFVKALLREDRQSDLQYHASYYAHIPRDLPAKCQLPEVVTLPNGRTIHRPPAWA